MKTFGRAHVSQAHEHGIDLSIEGGAGFSIQVLESTLVRVRYQPASGYRKPARTSPGPDASAMTPADSVAQSPN